MLISIWLTVCLLFIFIQDLRSRAVYWLLFPVLLALLLTDAYRGQTTGTLLFNISVNLSFVSIQLLVLSAWFSYREKKWVWITDGYLGWGDILFLVCVAFYFPPVNYVVYYMASLVVTLAVSLPFLAKSGGSWKVPLAGIQSILLLGLLSVCWAFKWSPFDDSLIISFLQP
ncbi:hypothetical protein [Hufsiella ginkgonis]|uniref:Prepilin type IV endopeptidase peptidase domain-containing protein n=1 Tax=Hufsiella ginkgonis TaxID=2695274 RepID=A0A7K1XYE4_9SPHI|nr:hypothetical protein [Hufsiella ginkgonis]MXV15759.1 hypothetical protein [Hufsiella ginkgonis]